MTNCDNNCASCNLDCSDRKDFGYKLNSKSKIKKIYAIVSGKGGVGKSSVTALLASACARNGYKTAVLDGDITGPSMTKMFGITTKAYSDGKLIMPAITKENIKVISTNMLLETDETPVIFRGPMISGLIKQYYEEVLWGDIDYMFVDLPPGTGDVPLTIMQSIPLDGAIIVTTPQDLVSMIVSKSVNMLNSMNIPITGIIENMSYVECNDCGNRIYVFGESNIDELAKKYNLNVLAKLPLDSTMAQLSDDGFVGNIKVKEIEEIVKNGLV